MQENDQLMCSGQRFYFKIHIQTRITSTLCIRSPHIIHWLYFTHRWLPQEGVEEREPSHGQSYLLIVDFSFLKKNTLRVEIFTLNT